MEKHKNRSVKPVFTGFSALALTAYLFLFFTHPAAADGPWLPENISVLGEKIDFLYRIIFYMTTVTFFLVQGVLLFFIIKYRERPGQKALYFHESATLELIWWVVPGLILFFLAVYQWNTWVQAKVSEPKSSGALRVEALSQQFSWSFRYAGPDGKFNTRDDVSTAAELHIPEGKPVFLQLQARDVIHSFFLPNLRVKQDAVPGVISQVWFQASKTGTYEIACAELCGIMHFAMKGQLIIHTQQEFDQWLQEHYETKEEPAPWGWDWVEENKNVPVKRES